MSGESLSWKIDECAVYIDRMRVRGWCYHSSPRIVRVDLVFGANSARYPVPYGVTSPDVAQALGPEAGHARFDCWVNAPSELLGTVFDLHCTLEDGSVLIGQDGLTSAAIGDAYFQSWEDFVVLLGRIESGAVLEIGSRARSAITRNHRVPAHLEYVGLDILPGPNVDVVGDVHELSTLFPEKRFAAAFSVSVFEHLAMPWKVVLELNRVLEPGAWVYSMTHQSWPLHEEPWDFWRFSRHTWQTIFNAATGFEVVSAVMGEPASIHARRTSPVTRNMPESPAYLGSACLVRKVAESSLQWPVSISVAATASYPTGELKTPPTCDNC